MDTNNQVISQSSSPPVGQENIVTQYHSNYYKKLVALLVVLIIAFVVAAFIFWTRQTQTSKTAQITPFSTLQPVTTTPSPTVNPESTQSANWKTYTNNELGITFKYPVRLNLSQPQAGGVMNFVGFYGTSKADSILLNYTLFTGALDQFISKARAGQTEMPVYSSLDYSTSKTIKVAGTQATKYSDSYGGAGVYFLSKKHGFLFYSDITNQNEIDQILSTFKFTAQ